MVKLAMNPAIKYEDQANVRLVNEIHEGEGMHLKGVSILPLYSNLGTATTSSVQSNKPLVMGYLNEKVSSHSLSESNFLPIHGRAVC